MKISYLVTCHNETNTLKKCITTLIDFKNTEDEIIVLDDFSDNEITKDILSELKKTDVRIISHALNRNYGEHKNYGSRKCGGDWIFQIDADEIPNPTLIVNLHEIIKLNPTIELLYVPRVNDFIGVTEEHAKHWGWRLTRHPEYDNRPIVNWPDYQGRLYKNDANRIKWNGRLHEKINGHVSFSTLPLEFDFSLYHEKTIEKQIETNLRYNKLFTEKENRGHNVFESTLKT